MYPVLEHKILGAKGGMFVCGCEQTPADYMLACELNTILLMLKKDID